jgi:hypothetical protein
MQKLVRTYRFASSQGDLSPKQIQRAFSQLLKSQDILRESFSVDLFLGRKTHEPRSKEDTTTNRTTAAARPCDLSSIAGKQPR